MKVVAKNSKARFDFEIIDTIEAGIQLTGQEVKSCRSGHVHLSGAYVSLRGAKPVLKQAKISAYVYAGPLPDYDEGRDRFLLVSKQQIERLKATEQEKGMTIVPLEVRAGRHIKLLLGIGRGRKKVDKRQRIRERETGKKLKRGEEV